MALNPRQTKFLEVLLTSQTITEASKKAGITENTAYKYLADAEFNKEYTEAKRASLQHVSTRLNEIALRSISVLDEIANNPDETGASRVRAVQVALDYAFKAMEIEDLNARMNELEKLLQSMEDEKL